MTHAPSSPVTTVEAIREALIKAVDSPAIEALARLFHPRVLVVGNSYSESVVDILAPRLIAELALGAAQAARPIPHPFEHEPTGDHLTGDELRKYLRGSPAIRAEAAEKGLTEDEAIEQLVQISGRASSASSTDPRPTIDDVPSCGQENEALAGPNYIDEIAPGATSTDRGGK